EDGEVFDDVLAKLAAQIQHEPRTHAHVAPSQSGNRDTRNVEKRCHWRGRNCDSQMNGQVALPARSLQGEHPHVLPDREGNEAPDVKIDELIGSLLREVVVWPIPLLHYLMCLPAEQQAQARHNGKQVGHRNDEYSSTALAAMARVAVFEFGS